MPDRPLGYEAATRFYRARGERLVRGIGLAVLLGIVVWVGLIRRHGWLDHAILDGALLLLAFFLFRALRALARGRGAWEIRIAGERLCLRRPDEAAEQSVELGDVEHVMVAEYGAGKSRYTRVYLLLRDGRCWEVPAELLFPRGPLFRAIRRAAPQVTVVTNTDMPGRDPMRATTGVGAG